MVGRCTCIVIGPLVPPLNELRRVTDPWCEMHGDQHNFSSDVPTESRTPTTKNGGTDEDRSGANPARS